jgi:hypothetical protein
MGERLLGARQEPIVLRCHPWSCACRRLLGTARLVDGAIYLAQRVARGKGFTESSDTLSSIWGATTPVEAGSESVSDGGEEEGNLCAPR